MCWFLSSKLTSTKCSKVLSCDDYNGGIAFGSNFGDIKLIPRTKCIYFKNGVAVLSCTDCSTYSGGSTASSDITDPGSPFSTASSHSEDSSSNHQHQPQLQQQPPKMPPNLSAHHPPWPWSGGESPPLKRLHANEKTVSAKRLRLDASAAATTVPSLCTSAVKSTLPTTKHAGTHTLVETGKRALRKPATEAASCKVQQGKITEYFKAQMKANNTVKKELGILVKSDGVQQYLTLLDGGPKVMLNGSKCARFAPDLYKKLDVRTVAVAAPIKKVMLDTKTKKISQVITVPRKILPGPRPEHRPKTMIAPTVKLTALRFPHQDVAYLTSKTTKPADDMLIAATAKAPVLKKMAVAKTASAKASSAVVPIVKLSNMPSKLNGSHVHHNLNSLSVETAVPTVPSAKPKAAATTAADCASIVPVAVSSPSATQKLQASPKCGGGAPSEPAKKCTVDSTKSSDSDSGVSVRDLLTVSVAHTIAPHAEPQKSPILSQPKTIRFPAKQTQSESQKERRRADQGDSGLCRWSECQAQFDTSGALLEHLQIKHVISQATQEHYVCLWVGCKVHGRTSCSRSWLERHVLSHAGNKPFRCIVDGCGCRFSSQQTLERHVNSHFNASENGSNGSTKKSFESGSAKLFKRNGKKLRYRRQPWSARMFDFFDAGIMEGLQHRLVTMTENRTMGEVCKTPGDTVTVQSRVMARRVEPDGTRKVLLRWYPPDIIPDEWTSECEWRKSRTVSIPTLEPSALDALKETLFPLKSDTTNQTHRQKNRRKRVAKNS